MKIYPRRLGIIAAVIDEGGLSEGAQAFGKSQPSVSRSFALLENRLGISLFNLRRKSLQPTIF